MKKWLLIFAVSVFEFASKANSISYTNNIGETLTDWTNTVSLEQFNPAIGTLNSVQITVQSDLDTTLTVQNVSPTSSSGSAITQLKQYLQTGSFTFFTNALVLDYASPDFEYTLPSFQVLSSGDLLANYSVTSNPLTDNSTLTAFTGTSFVDFTTYTFARSFLANTGGNTGAGQTTQSDLHTIVIYGFTPYPTPEPSVLALCGFGLAAISFARRQRN
jgi:hypothetical protein